VAYWHVSHTSALLLVVVSNTFSLFGLKPGFSGILETLYRAFQWCSRVRL